MGYNVGQLGRVGIAHQSDWGTATTSGFTDLECEASLPPVGREVFERTAIRSGHYALAPIEGSQQGQEWQITFPMHGYSTTQPTTAPSISNSGTILHPEAQILRGVLGKGHTNGYLHNGTAASTDNGTLVVAESAVTGTIGDHFNPGQCVAVNVTPTGSSTEQARGAFITEATSVGSADDTLTLLQNLGGTVALGGHIFGAKTLFLDSSADSVEPDYFTLEWRSLDKDSRLLLDSCVVKACEITIDPRGVPTMTVTFVVNGITADDDSVTALADTSYSLPRLPICSGLNAARFLEGNTATAVNNLSIEISQDLAPRLDHNASNGVGGLLATNRTVVCKYSKLLTGAPTTSLDTSPDTIFFQVGNAFGNMMCMTIPTPVHMEVGGLGDQEGLISQEVTYHVGNYTGDTASGVTNDPADSDFRIAFL